MPCGTLWSASMIRSGNIIAKWEKYRNEMGEGCCYIPETEYLSYLSLFSYSQTTYTMEIKPATETKDSIYEIDIWASEVKSPPQTVAYWIL